MSWSVGSSGKKDEVLYELRKQIQCLDSYAGAPEPSGMSDTENSLRRQACTLLYDTVRVHRLVGEGALADYSHINAVAYGSESRDSDGNLFDTIHVEVVVLQKKTDNA